MSVNISKTKRERLIQKIKAIKEFISAAPQDENTARLSAYAADIEKDVKRKKYGLVFEDHSESEDERLKTHAPFLVEQKELSINSGNGECPNFLIEGDNLAALTILEKTHKGKIDLIYIDPPYNTGNKDFVYDDNFVDTGDTFRHSKWLSFMDKRLRIAQRLLSERGMIYISINDKESHALKLLCDDIFGPNNFINDIAVELSPSSGVKRAHKNKGYIKNRESILVYANGNVRIKELYDEWTDYDSHYSIYFDGQKYCSLLSEIKRAFPEYKGINSKMYLFYDDVRAFLTENASRIFRDHDASKWAIENAESGEEVYRGEYRIIKVFNPKTADEYELLKSKKNGGYSRLEPLEWNVVDGKLKTLRGDLWLDFDKDMGNVSKEGGVKFPNGKKPVRLLKDIIYSATTKTSTVLDFFAGSGTTGHAVMKLNAEDGGSRRFILCAKDENGICRDITYKRIKNVIDGDGYASGMKYYKVEYLPTEDKLYYEYADELLKHMRELVELENGVDLERSERFDIIETERELDEYAASLGAVDIMSKVVYLGHDVLPTDAQDELFCDLGIEVRVIPEYYYGEED